MSPHSPELGSPKRPFRLFWTMVAVGVVIVMEGIRYFGSPDNPGQNLRPQDPVQSAPVQEIEIDPDDALLQDGETASLFASEENGVWVALTPDSFQDLTRCLQKAQSADLAALKEAGKIVQVPNRTKATILAGSVVGYELKLMEGEHAEERVHVPAEFVHRPGEEVSQPVNGDGRDGLHPTRQPDETLDNSSK